MCQLNIQPEWQQRLGALGLDTLPALLELRLDEQEKERRVCGLHCLELDQHTKLCLKRDEECGLGHIVCGLFRFRLPQSRCRRERLNIEMLAAEGFIVPELVAWGEKRLLGLPRAGLLLLRPPSTLALPAFLEAEFDLQVRHDMVEKAESLLRRLQERGYDWQDCVAKNFVVLPDHRLGLCNLESVRKSKSLSQELCQRQFEKFYASLCSA